MLSASLSRGDIRFGVFEVDVQARELRKKGSKVKLQQQPFELLLILLQRPGQVVSRDELRQKLWPANVYVDFDRSLNKAMVKLREALGDSAESPLYVETLPRIGYRFIGSITETLPTPPELEANAWQTPIGVTRPEAGAATSERRERRERMEPLVAAQSSNSQIWLGALGVAVALVIVAGVGLGTHGWRDRFSAHAAKPEIRSVAVLPLANLSGDPQQEYFADGMTEELIFELGKASGARVISRQSVMQYKGSKKPLQEIARELNVDAVVEGAVERSGDRLRVSVHLDQVSPETQLWADQYNRDIHDVLQLQDEIARTVTNEIQVRLTSQERASFASARPVDPEAHDDYLRGRYQITQMLTRPASRSAGPAPKDDNVRLAIGYFKQAIEKEPSYARAYAGLADSYILLGGPGMGANPPKKDLPAARAAVTKALELDPSLGEAHFSLAQITELYDWNWSETEKEYKAALRLSPNYADVHLQYGRFLQAMGRNDEAMTQMRYATALDPFDTFTRVVVAYVTYVSGQYDSAIDQFKTLDEDLGLGWAYREKKMYPEAIAALQNNLIIAGPVRLASLADVYGLSGKKSEARKLIDELKKESRQRYISGVLFAEAYGGIGEKDEALTWLEKAYDDRDQWMVYMASYPGMDPLRSEPRFQALLRRMNFPQSIIPDHQKASPPKASPPS